MAEDRYKAQARSILEGCPFSVEDAIAADLREADRENQRLRLELAWALEVLERHADSDALLQVIREKRSALERVKAS